MKAPDKIYVTESLIKTPYGNEWSPTPYISRENTEYIRKDALLEWTYKRLEEFRYIAKISNDVAADGEVDAFEELIDKLNSM